ncbi:MAG: hypothetical protein ABH830_05190 [Patescibacteria group bacterium]
MKLKWKFLIFFAVLASLVFMQGVAMAEEARADAVAYVSYAPQTSYAGTDEKRFLIVPNSLTHFQNIPHAYQATEVGSRGWKIFYYPFLSEVSAEMLLNKKRDPWFSKPYNSCLLYRLQPNNDPIQIMESFPSRPNDKLLGVLRVAGAEGAPDLSAVMSALAYAKEQTYTRRVVILKRNRPETVGKGFAIGSGAIYSKMLGPVGNAVDEQAGAVGVQAMIGKVRAYVTDPAQAEVWALNDPSPEERVEVSLTQDLSAQDFSRSQPTAKISSSMSYHGTPIFFATDKFNIEENQKPAINDIVTYIFTNLEKIISNGEKIFFIGYCDIRATEIHNLELGMNRAKTVAFTVYNELSKKIDHRILDENKIINAVTAGENDPLFEGFDLNRRVDMVVAPFFTRPIPNPPLVVKK